MFTDYTKTDAEKWLRLANASAPGGVWKAPMQIPRDKDAYAVFGNPHFYLDDHGDGHASAVWEKANIIKSPILPLLPGPKRYRFMHRLAVPFFVEALRRVVLVAPGYVIKVFGVFNVRLKKTAAARRPGGADQAKNWSKHGLGTACDINPEENPNHPTKLITDFPPALVWSFESVGFQWGGRWKATKDGMHFQLVKE